MAVKGVFASDQNIQGTVKGDFASALLQTMPTGSAPLLALSSGMKSEGATATVVTWFEENHLAGRINVTNNAASGFSLVVDDASQVTAGMMFFSESTGEYFFVEAVVGSTLTVTRGFGGTTVTALDGSSTPEPIQRVGTAFEEGSAKPVSIANIGFPRFNYQQIFRNPWDATRTAKRVQYWTGDVVAKNRQDAAGFHAEDIEKSIVWGRKAIGVLNGKPFRTMDGIEAMIITNKVVASNPIDWDDIDAFLRTIFEINIKGQPNERISFCGNTVLQVLNKIARLEGEINIIPGQTEFGLKVNKWLTPYGDVTLMTHPLMNESPHWTKDWIVLHPGAMMTSWLERTFEDRNDRDGTRAGADADFGVITSEMSVKYMAEATAGYYSDIQTAQVSS